MAISIKGVNTGVIRKSNNFIALALKIKEPRNKESLFFMSVMELRDLLIALESRLHQKHKLDAAARLQYEQARDKVIKKMAENIPHERLGISTLWHLPYCLSQYSYGSYCAINSIQFQTVFRQQLLPDTIFDTS